jgi:hypothetical protein
MFAIAPRIPHGRGMFVKIMEFGRAWHHPCLMATARPFDRLAEFWQFKRQFSMKSCNQTLPTLTGNPKRRTLSLLWVIRRRPPLLDTI